MKRLVLTCVSALLLGGCAHFQGGTGSYSETDDSYGSSPDFNQQRENDLNDLGWERNPKNMRPGGQPRVPGHSVDIQNEPQ